MGGGHHVTAVTGPEATRKGLRVIGLSALILFGSAVLRFAVAAITGSVALLAAGLDDLGDVLTTVALFLAFKGSRRAADRRYTFGYSRLEDLGGVLVVLVIWSSAAFAAFEAVRKLVGDHSVDHVGIAVAAAAAGAVANGAVAAYKVRTGRKIGSEPLVADGKHAATDSLASIAAVIGLGFAAAGFEQADPIAAFIVVIAIAFVAFDATRHVLARLLDAIDPDLVDRIVSSCTRVEGVVSCGRIQARWAGRSLYVVVTVAVDGELSLAGAHEVGERVHHAILHDVTGVVQVDVHVDPWEPHGYEAHRETDSHVVTPDEYRHLH